MCFQKKTEASSPAVSSGLDSLLDKDWRGRGFDQDVDQLIKFIQSDRSTRRPSQVRRLPPFSFCASSTPYSFSLFLASSSGILVPPTLRAKGEESDEFRSLFFGAVPLNVMS